MGRLRLHDGLAVGLLLVGLTAAQAAIAADGAAGRVFKKEDEVRARNLRTGQTFEGKDILTALQWLIDGLTNGDESQAGGKIVVEDGIYVTDAQQACRLRTGIHLTAARNKGAVLRMGRDAGARWFFRGREVENVIVDGFVFDGNRSAHSTALELTQDASAGDRVIDVENAAAFEGARLGEGRDVWTTPGGFKIGDGEKSERAKAESIELKEERIKLQRPLQHDYAAGEAKGTYYAAIGGVALNGEELTVRHCKFIRTQESPVLFVSGGKSQPGAKVLEHNVVINHRGDACIRLQRGAYGGVIRQNYVERPHAWYQRFWGEGIALEGNHHSICTGNVIKGPGDRLIRANDADHCTITANTVWVPTPPVLSDSAAWKPLRGREKIVEAESVKEGHAALPLRLRAGPTQDPGVRAALDGMSRKWSATTGPAAGKTDRKGHYRFNRLYLELRVSLAGVPVHLRLVDSNGRFADYRKRAWAADKRQILGFDLTDPDASSKKALDWADIAEVQVYLEAEKEEAELTLEKLRHGQRTGWGITVWGASDTTVSDNTFYGVGGERGTIYYGSGGWSASQNLTISGNTLTYCYDGIGFAEQSERRIAVNGNTLYATLGGIRGDVAASGNIIAFDSSNGGTQYSLQARTATGNYLYMTRGLRLIGDGPTSATGNVLLEYAGPGIVLEGRAGMAAQNMLRSSLNDGAPAVLQSRGRADHVVRGNWIREEDRAFRIRGNGAVITDNVVSNAGADPVRVDGSTKAYRDNIGAPRLQERVDLLPGHSPAGRIDGIGRSEDHQPTVQSVDPVPETTPDVAYAYETYCQWDPEADEWDLIIDWKRDPDEAMTVRVRIDH